MPHSDMVLLIWSTVLAQLTKAYMAETSCSQLVLVDSATHMESVCSSRSCRLACLTQPSVFVSLLFCRTWSVLKCFGVLGRSVLGHAGCSHLPALPHGCCCQDRGEVVLLCQQTVRERAGGVKKKKG